jgi:hypothetical protein
MDFMPVATAVADVRWSSGREDEALAEGDVVDEVEFPPLQPARATMARAAASPARTGEVLMSLLRSVIRRHAST